jgi:uncharacterized protein (DUF362 family)
MDEHCSGLSRRGFVGGLAAIASATAITGLVSEAKAEADLIAKAPEGFQPFALPGTVVRVKGKGDFPSLMHKNQIWPKPEVAKRLFEKAMLELTGAADLVAAMKRFVHPADLVAVKTNGIAGSQMATSFELVAAVVEAVVAAGVAPERITVFEQYNGYLLASRVGAPKFELPRGVKFSCHNSKDTAVPPVKVYEGITTRYCRQLVEATCVINMPLIKDHSICGYTGAMKNVTHGCINNPEAHHAHGANPQIAMLYAHPIVTSRVRLHVSDGFRLMYDKGPLYKDPNTVVPHGSVYVATDPVALDTVGAKALDDERLKHGLKSLAASGRAPKYIQTGSELGLGVAALEQIRLKSFEI